MSQRFRFIGATLLVGAVITGCVSLIPYAPKETLVKDLGMEKARVQLKETVLRARQTIMGVITSVDVTEESLKVKSQQTTIGMFYIPETHQLDNEVYFVALQKADIYANNYVFVSAQNGALVLQILFNDLKDAQSFVDLLMSFRANKRPG